MNYNIEEIDLSLAIQLQAQFEEELRVQRIKDEEKQKSLEIVGHKWSAKWMSLPEPEQEKLSVSLVDPCWEYLDPNPNIHDLFLTFNHQFFWGRLMGVEVKWSPRMTLCAGVCSYEGRGGLCSVRLSTPLLKLRPRKDLIETLLHEMIHAYLFVTHNNTDHDGHGPQFHTHMYRINKLAGTNISVYHSFHDEVNVYRQHIWQCDGPCRRRPPYYGLVKRSMNRPPSPRDVWWERHVQSCGGKYTKIKEPEGYGQSKSKRKTKDESSKDKDIRNYFPATGNKKPKSSSDKENKDSFKFPASGKMESKKVGSVPANQNTPAGVKRLDIQNAANSSVHGFGSGNSQRSSGSGTFKGSGKGSVSSGTALRNSGGSKTIVVSNKGTKQQLDSKDKKENVSRPNETFASFSGRGYTLGTASSSGRSRLLAQFDQPVKRRNNNNSSELKLDLPCTSNTEDDALCPLCQVRVNSNDFEDHIADCLGDIDFNSDIETNINIDSDSSTVDNKLRNADSNNEDYIVLSDDENIPSQSGEKRFPCPVCSEKFKECDINTHVNNHFS